MKWIIVLCIASSCCSQTVSLVESPPMSARNNYYVSNRPPLKPNPFIKLPVGAIRPDGWLGVYLERQREGLTGQLDTISAWLQKDGNAWLSKDGKGQWGWEEVPYWLKGFANIGYILDDKTMIDEARVWIEAVLRSQRDNGDFGPDHRFEDGSRDYWANMVMLFCLQSYYEYTGDDRVLTLMSRYFRYQATVPDEKMLTGYWQRMRGGDNLFSIYWLYNRTGQEWLLEAAEKIHRNTADWMMNETLPNWHNVNIAQCFREPATYYLQSHNPDHLHATYANFRIIRERYGQVPGGMFGSDENCRPGYDDPRQATETCGLVEQMHSNEILFGITGDVFWADHCEEVAFNMYPASTTADFRALRYFVAPNMVLSDRADKHPGIDNSGPFFIMNPLSHRCCQHNHAFGWPYYAEHLFMATPDNGVCAVLYSAASVNVRVGDGTAVTLKSETRYPFEEHVRFTVSAPKPVRFPFYLRVPNWCKDASVRVNNRPVEVNSEPGRFIRIEREWKNGDIVSYTLPMQTQVRTWTKNRNSVSVDYGPLTFSLKIDERYEPCDPTATAVWDAKWRDDTDTSQWPAIEIFPDSAWNYGLVLNADDPAASFTLRKKPWPTDDFPFTPQSTPLEMTVTARQIPQWKLDRFGLCGRLQDSPVVSDRPDKTVTLIPMGAARLRISAFPTIADGPDGHVWKEPIVADVTASHIHSGDSTDILDGHEPTASDDHNIPRFTWWPRRGTEEWIAFELDQPRVISSLGVYWFDDTGIGQCRIPKAWRLTYKTQNGQWKAVNAKGAYNLDKDRYNRLEFEPVRTTALRIEARLQDDFSGGILKVDLHPDMKTN
ncbi:MAG TPA: hypothetical protein ENN97_10570 [Phycisphaerales bacterium]|nr:hypothetical protein [Phycisphaerales bacterium]